MFSRRRGCQRAPPPALMPPTPHLWRALRWGRGRIHGTQHSWANFLGEKKKIISDSLWGDLPQSRLLGVVGFAGSGAPRKEAGERLPGYRWV